MEKFEIEVVHVKANPEKQLEFSDWSVEEPQELIA